MRYCVIAIMLVALAVPAAAQMYLESGGPPIRYDDSIPPDGSQWHELAPVFCNVHVQNSYEDNGDAVVSECDVIVIDGIRNHVDWAGPTYYLVAAEAPDERWLEPGEIPDEWHEVAPNFCTYWQVLDWLDEDLDGGISFCDMVLFSDGWWHVEDVRLDITVTEEPSPVEPTTWGKVKSFFAELF